MAAKRFAVALGLGVWSVAGSAGANHATTSLMVRVEPEARLDPQQIKLDFRISAGGAADARWQRAQVAAWVRPLPGQQVRILARLTKLEGPEGAIAPASLRWAGSVRDATGGAEQATCSSGVFAKDGAQDLVRGWERPGRLTCAIDFELRSAGLTAGEYSGMVELFLEQQ